MPSNTSKTLKSLNVTNGRRSKVIQFFMQLPYDMVDELIVSAASNRDTKRVITKIKDISQKMLYVFHSPTTRKKFVEGAYEHIKDKVPLDLTTAKYEDIISLINEENKTEVAIFFFRWCYEKNEDGVSNDSLYFNIFVDSALFTAICKDSSLPDITELVETPPALISDIENSVSENMEDDKKSESSPEKETPVVKKAAKTTSAVKKKEFENPKTFKLLGKIEKKTTFYNFFPQYDLTSGEIKELSSTEVKVEFPTNGGFNLAYQFKGLSDFFLEKITGGLDEKGFSKRAFVIDLDKSKLEENSNDIYKVKLDLQKLVNSKVSLDKIVQPAHYYDVYRIVTSDMDVISQNAFINGNITLNEDDIEENESVLLLYNEKYYGPFNARFRIIDNKYYVRADANVNNYLVPYFSEDSLHLFDLEEQEAYGDPIYLPYAYIIGENSKYDAITDDILISKITESVSLDMASQDPEEFVHLCNNSPFLADAPQHIIENRLARLQTIISSIDKFKEKKHEIFEALLAYYQTEPSAVSDKLITDSDAFKELQAKYIREKRKSEDTDKQVAELQKENEALNTQLAEISKINSGAASPDEILRLKAKIEELQKELEDKNNFDNLSSNIEDLKEEQDKLKHTNEYLAGQVKEYEGRIKTAKDEVSNAIKAGAADMANLAFEPFVASEMIRKAASWESEEENRKFIALHSQLAAVTPSPLVDEKLVDYIVDYVKKRRDYSKNDILNIYVNLAQNFITVFSGEPGTGKTSMCNIISDTLGLMNYGNTLNRFVSVSVERGWSSKRDFIGYFNPLTRKYDKSNSKIYDALRTLDTEKGSSEYPYVIMLDEANLSPIEYYWADFMRLTDRTSDNDAYINIGTDRELYVPETLRFVATINTDQTTEPLSPRLIDRAGIIKLPRVSPRPIAKDLPAPTEIISWDNFINTFSKDSTISAITSKAMNEIYDLFSAAGMNVSPRIQLGIEKYVKAAQAIMEDESDVLAREKALDFAVVQKLLPKINGYYSNYEKFFSSLKQLCKEYSLKMTEEAVNKIIEAQERNMGYCQYLI